MELKIYDLTPATYSGATTDLYFDPDEFEVYVFSATGNGVPKAVYERRHLHLGPMPRDLADTAHVADWLQANSGILEEISAGHNIEWDERTSYQRGYLTEEAEEILLDLQRDWQDYLAQGYPIRWGAAEFFGPVHRETLCELLSGEVTSLAEWAEAETQNESEYYLDAEDVLAWAMDALREWIAENEDEGPTQELAIARKLLD